MNPRSAELHPQVQAYLHELHVLRQLSPHTIKAYQADLSELQQSAQEDGFELIAVTNGHIRRWAPIRDKRWVESGFSLSFQLKASTLWQRDDNTVIYDLEAKTYNDLVLRRNFRMAVPCILILFALPPDPAQWLIYNEEEMRLRGSCYWDYLSGAPTENRQSVRIRIPRQQRLTSESDSRDRGSIDPGND